MLMQALLRLLNRKEFEGISVQEIIEETASLNRANTFYLHYADKNALLQAMTAARFRDLIAHRGLSFSNCDGALRAIALGVCDYLAETTNCPSQLARMPLEGSIISVMEDIFEEGAARHGVVPGPESRLFATTAAWAIFGAARNWYQDLPNRIPARRNGRQNRNHGQLTNLPLLTPHNVPWDSPPVNNLGVPHLRHALVFRGPHGQVFVTWGGYGWQCGMQPLQPAHIVFSFVFLVCHSRRESAVVLLLQLYLSPISPQACKASPQPASPAF